MVEKLPFLYYENFDEDPHPALRFESPSIYQKPGSQIRDFSNSLNPPILHRKDTLVSPSYPYYPIFRDLTEAEEKAGLLSRPGIGFKNQWIQFLEAMNLRVEGHTLQRMQTSPSQLNEA